MLPDLECEYDVAHRYLDTLDHDADRFDFVLLDDSDRYNGVSPLHHQFGETIRGSLRQLWQYLIEANQLGLGVFVTVNETDGVGRKEWNIARVRTLWHEDDHKQGTSQFPQAPPSMVVQTSTGKFHSYWIVEDDWWVREDAVARAEFSGCMARMVRDYGSDPNAKDLPRLLRVPGFYHQKSEPQKVKLLHCSDDRYTRSQLVELFPAVEEAAATRPIPPMPNIQLDGETKYRLKCTLRMISSDRYDIWLTVGMGLHSAYNGGTDGLHLWMEWASQSKKFNQREHGEKWLSFSNNRDRKIGLGSIFKLGKESIFNA